MCDIDSMKDSLGLDPLCLQDADLASLIGQCRIDHTIAPVADTPGGSRAGYARWNEFLEECIQRYASARNQPTQAQGASRMSPYLHYGMVSPFRLARETAEVAKTSEGAKKFLDELITWRDLSFHFCYHNHDTLDTLEAIPKWAQSTLDQHIDDPREDNCSWETLARAQTGRPFWDAAQQSLLRHGQLHNNIRRTWGKAIIPWLQTPRRALQLTLDLNHRYSLDGRDPCSYGGVLWCYGQFDQPAEDDSPVFGRIRNRDQNKHAKRIDFAKFKEIVGRPIAKRLPRIAVVGAGMAGLTAARTLADHGIDVTVFDKSRGLGGRMSTRRATDESTNSLAKPLRFDHGAQYFTARDGRFSRLVNSWIHDGIVQPWMGKIVRLSNQGKILEQKGGTPRYVAVPGMNALAKHLATDLTLQLGTPIVRMRRIANRWEVENAEGQKHGPFDIVLVSCPPVQTSKLIDGHTDLVQQVNQVQMLPCWAMMVADESLAGISYDGAFVDEHLISWIAHNSGKPGRPSTPAWVVHASSTWSQEHIEDDPGVVQSEMKCAFETLVGKTISTPKYLNVHRWMHAIASNPVDQHSLFDRSSGIGCCGDWCGGSRVEAAYLSGCSMAGDVLRHYTIDRPAYDSGQSSQLSLFA